MQGRARSEPLVGAVARPRPSIAFQLGTWARAIPTELSVRVMGQDGLDGVAVHAGGRLFLALP
jgi:hypothetical protein